MSVVTEAEALATTPPRAPVYKASLDRSRSNLDLDYYIQMRGPGHVSHFPMGEDRDFVRPRSPDVGWFLNVYPDGYPDDYGGDTWGHLSLSLQSTPSPGEAGLQFSARVTVNGLTREGTHRVGERGAWGWPRFLAHPELKYPHGPKTLRVQALIWGVRVGRGGSGSLCLASQLLAPKFSDVRLVVEGEELPAHRNVLAARSKVFAACFEHSGTLEAATAAVTIHEAAPAAVRRMLRFLYTGFLEKVEGEAWEGAAEEGRLTVAELCEVLALADRYDVAELRAETERMLVAAVDEASLALAARTALLHHADDLVQACQAVLSRMLPEPERWETELGEWRGLGPGLEEQHKQMSMVALGMTVVAARREVAELEAMLATAGWTVTGDLDPVRERLRQFLTEENRRFHPTPEERAADRAAAAAGAPRHGAIVQIPPWAQR